MIAGVILAAAAGAIPVSQGVERFPEARWWPGAGDRQVANMLGEIAHFGNTEFRTVAPGPQQLASRYLNGEIKSESERVAVLLGGAMFRDPALLPAYARAAESGTLRERQAAAVGLAWMLGEASPNLPTIPDRPETWRGLEGLVNSLIEATRTRSLVEIWVDSYLEAVGQPRRPGMVMVREPQRCLEAIHRLATPDHVMELVALWPLLASEEHRLQLLSTLEMVTLQEFTPRPRGERQPTGPWLHEAGLQRVDFWVDRVCQSGDGWALVRSNVVRNVFDDGAGATTLTPWLRVLSTDAPFAWPVAVEVLMTMGAPAVAMDRSNLGAPGNEASRTELLRFFPVSSQTGRTQR